MMQILYDKYKERFQQYYDGVKPINEKHDEVNKLKYHHTFRVVNEIKLLSDYLGLSEQEKFLARLVALFHDVGRFEQYARYQTFSDKNSVDHAELALQIIEENQLLSSLNNDDFELVKTAILNHNKLAIAEGLNEQQRHFSKLIRDADKLDILYVVTNRKKYFIPDDAKKNRTDLNPHFVENIKNHELVSYDEVKGMLDYVLLRMSWVFDLNFDYTIQQFKERNYFQNLLDQLPDTSHKEIIQLAIEGFIEKRVVLNS